MDKAVVCTSAVDLLDKHLDSLPHPEGVVRLVQFTHSSPGLKKLRHQIAEAVVLLLETKFTIEAL